MIRFLSSDSDSKTTISIAGRLQADHLGELEALCAEAQGELVLDLSELQNADDASIRRLRDLQDKGTRVTGASPYIRLRLERGR